MSFLQTAGFILGTEGPGDKDLFPDIPVSADTTPDKGDTRAAKAHLALEFDHTVAASYSGLNARQRSKARGRIATAIRVSFEHSGQMRYTQGAKRWSGIAGNKHPERGEFPTDSDCSSWGTWVLWSALYLLFGKPDIVNGASWRYGFTGSTVVHGKRVVHEKNIQLGDIAVYGPSLGRTEHEAVCIGGGYVASHGGPGVLKRPLHYRGDLLEIRRFV